MQPLEKALDDAFKKAPQLPENASKGLATALPWLALIGGILSLMGAWGIYGILNWTNNVLGSYSALYGYANPYVDTAMPLLWVSLALIVVQAIIMLVAFPALRAGKKSGWNLLFYSALVNVVYDVLYYVFAYNNIGSLLMALIGAAIGMYLLFQVRSYFAGGAAHSAAVKADTKEAPGKK
jgi:hypothetical protein